MPEELAAGCAGAFLKAVFGGLFSWLFPDTAEKWYRESRSASLFPMSAEEEKLRKELFPTREDKREKRRELRKSKRQRKARR